MKTAQVRPKNHLYPEDVSAIVASLPAVRTAPWQVQSSIAPKLHSQQKNTSPNPFGKGL
jgi:hypothetical protein